MDLGRGFRRAQPALHQRTFAQPAERRPAAPPGAGQHAPGVEAAIAPAAAVEVAASSACRAKLRRASRPRAVPSHQSSARKPPDLPEAAQATPVRSTTIDLDPTQAEKVRGAGADNPAAADHHAHRLAPRFPNSDADQVRPNRGDCQEGGCPLGLAACRQPPAQQRAVVALGANLGERRATLERAVALIAELGQVAARSAWLGTPALIHPDDPAQSYPEFLNGAVLSATGLRPEAILAGLHRIEARLGRDRSHRDRALAAAPDRPRPDRGGGSGRRPGRTCVCRIPRCTSASSCWPRSARSGRTGATRCWTGAPPSCWRELQRRSAIGARAPAGAAACAAAASRNCAAILTVVGADHARHPSGPPPGW